MRVRRVALPRARRACRCLRGLGSPWFLPGYRRLFSAFFHPCFVVTSSLAIDLIQCFTNSLATTATSSPFLREITPAVIPELRVLACIRSFGFRKNFCRQFLARLIREVRSVRFNFRPVYRHNSGIHQARSHTKSENLREQDRDRCLVPPAKSSKRSVVRKLVRGENSISDVFNATPLESSR
ncbi:hypothetical protein ACFPRL_27720 [Pseudoclavibacter helvolus]